MITIWVKSNHLHTMIQFLDSVNKDSTNIKYWTDKPHQSTDLIQMLLTYPEFIALRDNNKTIKD